MKKNVKTSQQAFLETFLINSTEVSGLKWILKFDSIRL